MHSCMYRTLTLLVSVFLLMYYEFSQPDTDWCAPRVIQANNCNTDIQSFVINTFLITTCSIHA